MSTDLGRVEAEAWFAATRDIDALQPHEARARILRLQGAMLAQPPEAQRLADCPLKHHYAPGAYAREMLIPAGIVIVGKIHKHAHINVVSKGRCTVFTETGTREIQAPLTFVSEPGTKRVVLAHDETVWTTVHVTTETDLERIEDYVIAKSYDELAAPEQPKIEGAEP